MTRKKLENKRGPKPERIKLQGDWRELVKKAIKKERPKDGWPEPPIKKERRGKSKP